MQITSQFVDASRSPVDLVTNKRFDFKSHHHITKPNRIRNFGESSGGWWSSMIHQIAAIFGAWLNDHFGWVFVGMPQAYWESIDFPKWMSQFSKHVGFSFKRFESWEFLLFHGALHSFWGGNCEVSVWQVFIEVKKMLGRIRAGKLAPDSSSIARPIFVSWCHKNDGFLFFCWQKCGWTINSMNNDWKKKLPSQSIPR